MKNVKNILSICFLFTISCVSLGCGGSGGGDQPDLGTVTGTVSLDGQPLSGVIILFTPEEGRQSTAVTDENGGYELAYTGDSKGAKIGKHTIGFTSSDDDSIKASAPIPPQYTIGSDTGLTAEVKAGENTFDFDLISK